MIELLKHIEFREPWFLLLGLLALPVFFLARRSPGRVVFSSLALLPARASSWRTRLAWLPDAGLAPVLRLRLVDDEATRAIWPEAFVADLVLRLSGQRLVVGLSIANTGTRAFAFTAALHSYLRVAAIEDVRLAGLHGCRYRDSADGNAPKQETAEALAIAGEVDRIYLDTPQLLRLDEPGATVRRSRRYFQ